MMCDGPISALAFGPHSQWMVTATEDGRLQRWDVATSERIGDDFGLGLGSKVKAVVVSANGQYILAGHEDGRVCMFEPSGELIGAPWKHDDSITSVAFTLDERLAVSGDGQGRVRIVSTDTHEPAMNDIWAGSILNLKPSPDGEALLIGGCEDGLVRFRDVQTGVVDGKTLPHGDTVNDIAFSPDGKLIATACDDKLVRLWDAETRTLIEPTLRHEHEVLCVSFSPDGKKLLTGRGQLWNVATAEMLTDAMPHSGEVYCSAFSPDGTRVVIGGERAAQLWDIQGDTPVMVGEPMLHEKDVRDVAFSPDDRYFATVAIDGKIRLWDARSARAVGPPLQERDEALSSVLVTSDGRLLITGSGEGTVLIRPAIPSLVGTPEQIQVWAELITGQELTSSGGLRRIAADAWRERAAELEKLGGSPLRRPTR